VSFLISLVLPVLAVVLYVRSYLERATVGREPLHVATGKALASGAVTGAAALLFLSALGVVVLASRGRVMTPPGLDVPAPLFWVTQFLIAAAIGAVVGALAMLALLPWFRARLAQITPA
jgi:hypothetical protein